MNNEIIPKSKIEEILLLANNENKKASIIIKSGRYNIINDRNEILKIILKACENHPEKYKLFLKGNIKLLGFLIGQTSKLSDGLANPGVVKEVLNSLTQK